MVLCGQDLDCSTQKAVLPNPDLSGIGVIISFLIPAWCTVLVVFGLFLSAENFPLSKKNELDHDLARALKMPFKCICKPFRGYGSFIPAWSIHKVVLLLSDQQLITATAIFTAAYANICEIDEYHFSFVYYTGAASFLTHQVTVMVVHDMLKDQPLMRAWRMLWVLAVFGLVFAANIHVSAGKSHRGSELSVPGRPAACSVRHPLVGLLWQRPLIATSVFWAWGLAAVVRDLCPELWLLLLRSYHWVYLKLMPLCNLLSGRYMCGWARAKMLKAGPGYIFWWLMEKAFLLLFALWYTISQVLTSSAIDLWRVITSLISVSFQLWLPDYKIEGENTWGFGQILPVMLLALPLFQTFEIIYDSWRGSKSSHMGKHQVLPTESPVPAVPHLRPTFSEESVPSANTNGYTAAVKYGTFRTYAGLPHKPPTQNTEIEMGRSFNGTREFTINGNKSGDLDSMESDPIEYRLYQSRVFRIWIRLLMAGIMGMVISLTLTQGMVL